MTPAAGRVGLASQSGSLGLAALDIATARELGFSSVVSIGNTADISSNDLLGFWHSDARTDVILLYLESFGDPRQFARLARTIGKSKPIVALKSGRASVGARARASHTNAFRTASEVTVDALFRQAGVIRTDTLDEMLDVADLLTHQPLPSGSRAAIIANVGGPAVMCAESCASYGLQVPGLSEPTRSLLRRILPPDAGVLNPVDMRPAATPEQYREAIRIVADDPNVDAIIAIYMNPLVGQPTNVARAVVAAVESIGEPKPVLSVFMSPAPLPNLATSTGRIPGYRMPEPAARALAHAVRYADWKSHHSETAEEPPDVRRQEAAMLLTDAVSAGSSWLASEDVRRLLMLYGVRTVEQRTVGTPDQAATAARELGGALALKLVARGSRQVAEGGDVQLHLRSATAVKGAAKKMAELVRSMPGVEQSAFVVQRMAPPGVEMLIGVVNDPQFGPTIACGPGGALRASLKDLSVRLAPLARSDASGMLRELRSFPLLKGYRGSSACDIPAMEDALLRIGALVHDHPCIAELDCNPVVVTTAGATVVNARIRVETTAPRRPLGALA